MKTNKNKNKRQASSSSDEGATCSDSTVVGSDSESENSNTSFTLVEGKNKRALRKALKKAKVARDQPEMDIDPSSAPTSRANDAKPSPAAVQQTQTTSTASVELTRNPVSASTQAVTAKTAPRTDCTRLRINYSKAVRTADDGIKIHCPDVETFRSLNKYLVDFKVQFHTYALEEERKLKAVIRGIPTDFPVDEIQADLCGQGFPVHSVHRLCRRDGSPLWLVLAVLPRTEEAKNIFNNLNMVCGLSGIRVEALHKKGGPGQCHRCQLYTTRPPTVMRTCAA
ncbi:Nucleic-acid-binding protein from transposon X-element [Eumeta japonica]|uniref:Nucleic-acid-binding protein from transposon X-element n=1 Tax=Eumeta variegata TaxID=151549 RepID=A0A4C1VB02_EUMVA|nr:Nucleic-acid-binding protein from transposon X-element [Eumeta japonica]